MFYKSEIKCKFITSFLFCSLSNNTSRRSIVVNVFQLDGRSYLQYQLDPGSTDTTPYYDQILYRICINMSIEEIKGCRHEDVYYMSAHCNGGSKSQKMMVKTTCEKLPQLQTAKPVSITYNKQLSKRKSRSESKLALENSNSKIILRQGNLAGCNGNNNRLSGINII